METEFFKAVKEKNISSLKTILEQGFDPNTTEKSKNGNSLHWAAFYGHVDVCRLLLESGAKVNSVTLDESCQSPLIWAIYSSNFETVKFLLDNGADINLAEGNGMSPFSIAIHKGFTLIAHYLF